MRRSYCCRSWFVANVLPLDSQSFLLAIDRRLPREPLNVLQAGLCDFDPSPRALILILILISFVAAVAAQGCIAINLWRIAQMSPSCYCPNPLPHLGAQLPAASCARNRAIE